MGTSLPGGWTDSDIRVMALTAPDHFLDGTRVRTHAHAHQQFTEHRTLADTGATSSGCGMPCIFLGSDRPKALLCWEPSLRGTICGDQVRLLLVRRPCWCRH